VAKNPKIQVPCNRDIDITAAIGIDDYYRPFENMEDPRKRGQYIIPKSDLSLMDNPNHIPRIFKIIKPETDYDSSLVLQELRDPKTRRMRGLELCQMSNDENIDYESM
jgi:hypothetical protein